MATRRQKTRVGLFLIACALLIAAGLVVVSGYKHEAKSNYEVEFNESVLGLSSGSVVVYQGVPVGNVSDIFVTNGNKAHVEVEITQGKVTLREGVQAQLVLYSLATGTMAISLSGGNPQGPPLPPGSMIKSTPSLIENVSSRVEEMLDELSSIAGTLRQGLTGMEEGDLTALVDEASRLLKEGKGFLDDARTTLNDVSGRAETGIEEFEKLIVDARKLITDTNQAVNTARGKIEALDIDRTEQSVNEALNEFTELADQLQKSADSFDQTTRAAMHEATNVHYSLRQTMDVLNEALSAVRDLADYLSQDPSSLVRGKGKPKGGN